MLTRYIPKTAIPVKRLESHPEMLAIVEALGDVVFDLQPVGSRVTCSPAPTDTDEDWLMRVDSNPAGILKSLGFTQDGQPEFYTGNDDGGFRSWRRGEINIVTTPDQEFYNRFLTATHLAKRYNLLDKSDRIALFQAILYGVDARNLQERPSTKVEETLLLPA
jgi:hypothetical protein